MKPRLKTLVFSGLLFLYALGILGQILKEVKIDMDGNGVKETVRVEKGHTGYSISIREEGNLKYPKLSSWDFYKLEVGDFNADSLKDVKYYTKENTGRIFFYSEKDTSFTSIGF